MDFEDQYDSGFLDSEIENGILTLYLDRDCSTKFRSSLNNYTNLLLYVNRMETTENIYFSKDFITSIHIYYYDGNIDNEYVSEPKVYSNSNFKTKIENLYHAIVISGYFYPENYFNENKIIQVLESGYDLVDIINNVYCTGRKVTGNGRLIRSQKINLFVNGEIPTWVFKEVLPLQEEVIEEGQVKIYKKYLDSNGNVYCATEPTQVSDLEIIGINADPGMKNIRFPYKGQLISPNIMIYYQGNSIDLSDIGKGAAANLDTFKRMYVKDEENKPKKVFHVNEVKLLKRFQEKLPIPEGTFTYFEYEDSVNKEKNSTVTWSEERDWVLDLPDCYESCELSGTELTVKFGEYLQIDYMVGDDMVRDYLFAKLLKDNNFYLDISMKMNSNLDLDNIITLNIYLNILKYISWSNTIMLVNSHNIYIIFNKDGFLENKEISKNNIKQKINYCYLIYESEENTNTIDRNNILIKPDENIFKFDDNIRLKQYLNIYRTVTINNLKCTNIYQSSIFIYSKFPPNTEVNLLVSGNIPLWLSKYFYSENKALPLEVKSGDRNGFCELVESDGSTEVTDEYFMINSINDMPAPGIGIDNTSPDNQCSMDLSSMSLTGLDWTGLNWTELTRWNL